MGRASRAKRERPTWARNRDIAAIVHRVEAIEAGITSRGPGIWDDLDWVRSQVEAHRLPEWPAWCWIPSAAVRTFTKRDDWASVVAAVGAWRQGRSIYRVDPETATALANTDLPEEIPAHVLLELSEWGLYLTGVETDPPLNGSFIHLDWSFDRRRPELRILADSGGEHDLLVALPHYLDHPQPHRFASPGHRDDRSPRTPARPGVRRSRRVRRSSRRARPPLVARHRPPHRRRAPLHLLRPA